MLQELRLDKISGGAGVPGLNREDAYQYKIPVPPLDVQAQIVDECQAIDAEVEQAEKEVSDCYQIAKEKVQACFAQGQVTALGTLVHINRESIDPTNFLRNPSFTLI